MTAQPAPASVNIPVLSLHDFTQGTDQQRQQFVQTLGQAYQDTGFAAIQGHTLSEELQAQLYDVVKRFFALPDNVKAQYVLAAGAGQRGYTPKNQENAKGRSVADLKEFYHVGQEVTDGDPIKAFYPDNIWPAEVADFAAVTTEAYRQLEATGRHILRALALYLDLPETFFDGHIHNGNSILRALHYFPIEDPDSLPPDAVRAAEHEDINLITLLMGASAEGLQIQTRDGQWVPVTAVPDSLVVNVGDMLQRLTNNRLRSTTHRVVNPPREVMHLPRYSIPFFLHPRRDMDLSVLPSCVDGAHPAQYSPITAGEFLNERLREIGLLK